MKPRIFKKNDEPAALSTTRQSGFTLIEVAVAMVIILVALLGVVFTFTYAITYNMGNNSRSQALAVLQQEAERIRAAKFTPTTTDAILLGGSQPTRDVTNATGTHFSVNIDVDNDPSTAAIDDGSSVPDASCTYKEITLTVTLASPSPGWQTAVPSRVVIRRTRGN
jgi:prepilin-type N-terminal cleavage/methylation domain-containing protein